VSGEGVIGRTIRDLESELPDECLITLVSRNGDTRVQNGDFELQRGDRVTFIGDRDAVREAMGLVSPE
jgi:Trk K+ transport system NAD-binding subunit